MASRLEQLLPAKYKNIPFFVRKEAITQIGQKRIKHQYPNAASVYGEAQGKSPFDCTINIFFAGSNWRDDYSRFKQALERSAPGRLQLPTFGLFNNIVAMPASAEAGQTSIGEISLSVNFFETIERPAPTTATLTEEDASAKAQEAREAMREEFDNAYETPATANNLITASDDLKKLGEKVSKITKKVREFRSYVRKVDRFVKRGERIAAILLTPGSPQGYLQSVADSLKATLGFNLAKQMAKVGEQLSNKMNEIVNDITPVPSSIVPKLPGDFIFDPLVPAWDNDNVERQQRNNNRYTVTNTFRLAGLISMYEVAAAISYTTTDEITEIKNTLEEFYIKLVEDDTTNVVIQTLKPILDELKGITEAVLQNKAQNTFNTITIKIRRPIPAPLLTYWLYGEYLRNQEDLANIGNVIIGLNTDKPAHKLVGDVKILELG